MRPSTTARTEEASIKAQATTTTTEVAAIVTTAVNVSTTTEAVASPTATTNGVAMKAVVGIESVVVNHFSKVALLTTTRAADTSHSTRLQTTSAAAMTGTTSSVPNRNHVPTITHSTKAINRIAEAITTTSPIITNAVSKATITTGQDPHLEAVSTRPPPPTTTEAVTTISSIVAMAVAEVGATCPTSTAAPVI